MQTKLTMLFKRSKLILSCILFMLSGCGGSGSDEGTTPLPVPIYNVSGELNRFEREQLSLNAVLVESGAEVAKFDWFVAMDGIEIYRVTKPPTELNISMFLPDITQDSTVIVKLQVTDINSNTSIKQVEVKVNAYPQLDTIIFSDPNLDACVKELAQTYPSYDSAMVTALICRSRGIIDISGIELLPNLSNVDLADNKIEDITKLAQLNKLDSLDLSINPIQDLSLISKLVQLKALKLNNVNIIFSVYLNSLIAMENLELENTKLVDIDAVAYMPNLNYLKINSNGFSSQSLEPIKNCKLLTVLEAENNSITDINLLVGLDKLIRVHLSNNNLTDITPLSSLTNLVALYIFNNNITDLSPLSSLQNLQYLYFYDNGLTNVSILANMQNLRYIGFGYDQISDLSPVSSLIGLKSLSANGMNIADINFLSNLSQLSSLNLTSNNISNISLLSSLTNMVQINLSYNNIQDITSLFDLPLDTEVNLIGNDQIQCSALDQLAAYLPDTADFKRPGSCIP